MPFPFVFANILVVNITEEHRLKSVIARELSYFLDFQNSQISFEYKCSFPDIFLLLPKLESQIKNAV